MTLGIIILTCAVLLGFLRVAFFFVMMIEKQSLRPLQRASDDHPKTRDAAKIVAEATSMLFQPVGVYSDGDKGWKEGIVSLLISPDHRVLLCIHHAAAARRYRFLTRTINGLWIITSSASTLRDPTGLTDEQMIPSKHFRVVHRYHLERLEKLLPSHGGEVVLFAPDAAATDLDELASERLDRFLELRLARLVPPATPNGSSRRWVYTPKGALKCGSILSITAIKNGANLALAKEKEWGFAKK